MGLHMPISSMFLVMVKVVVGKPLTNGWVMSTNLLVTLAMVTCRIRMEILATFLSGVYCMLEPSWVSFSLLSSDS